MLNVPNVSGKLGLFWFFVSIKNWHSRAISQWLLTLSLASMLLACGGSSPVERTYVGKLAGTDAYIGVVENGERIIAYVCDGNTISRWFQGPYSPSDGVTLVVGGQSLMLKSTPLGIEGTFDVGGAPSAFIAYDTPPGSEAGLYRAEVPINDQSIVGGWVFLPDRTHRGLTTFGGTALTTSNLNLTSGSVQLTSPTLTGFVTVRPVSTSTVSCAYSGAVVRSTGTRLAGVRVRLFDASVAPERLLGETTTDSSGGYKLTITQTVSSASKIYRAVVVSSSGQTLAQGTATTTCGANINLVVP